jgi:hypothetical protein
MLWISWALTASFANEKVSQSRISRAARRKAPGAARHKALPTLTRLTPSAENSCRPDGFQGGGLTGMFLENTLPVSAPPPLRFYAGDSGLGGTETNFESLTARRSARCSLSETA